VALIVIVLAVGLWRYVLGHPKRARSSATPSGGTSPPPDAGPPH
jgi:hypothetical protein